MIKLLLTILLISNLFISNKKLKAEDSYIDYFSISGIFYKSYRYDEGDYGTTTSGYSVGLGKQLIEKIILEYEYTSLRDDLTSINGVEIDGSLNSLHLGYVSDVNKIFYSDDPIDCYAVLKLGATYQSLDMKFRENNTIIRTESLDKITISYGFDFNAMMEEHIHLMLNYRYYSIGDASLQMGVKYLF